MIRRPPRSTLDRSSAASDVYKRQGLICVVVSEGETIESISKSCRVNKHDIVIFNESRFYLDTPLKDGQIIFLESKKRFNEDFSSHVVKESESLFDISQKYGIKTVSYTHLTLPTSDLV